MKAIWKDLYSRDINQVVEFKTLKYPIFSNSAKKLIFAQTSSVIDVVNKILDMIAAFVKMTLSKSHERKKARVLLSIFVIETFFLITVFQIFLWIDWWKMLTK